MSVNLYSSRCGSYEHILDHSTTSQLYSPMTCLNVIFRDCGGRRRSIIIGSFGEPESSGEQGSPDQCGADRDNVQIQSIKAKAKKRLKNECRICMLYAQTYIHILHSQQMYLEYEHCPKKCGTASEKVKILILAQPVKSFSKTIIAIYHIGERFLIIFVISG